MTKKKAVDVEPGEIVHLTPDEEIELKAEAIEEAKEELNDEAVEMEQQMRILELRVSGIPSMVWNHTKGGNVSRIFMTSDEESPNASVYIFPKGKGDIRMYMIPKNLLVIQYDIIEVPKQPKQTEQPEPSEDLMEDVPSDERHCVHAEDGDTTPCAGCEENAEETES